MNKELWVKSAKQVFLGQLIMLCEGVLGLISGIITLVSGAASLLSGDATGLGFAVVFAFIVSLVAVAGYVFVFLGIMGLKKATEDPAIAKGVGLLWIAAILALCGAVIALIPVIGSILGGLLAFAAFILNIVAYNNLKNCAPLEAISPAAAKGFGGLFVASIIALVGGILAWVPILGAIISLVAAILVVINWKKIATPIA